MNILELRRSLRPLSGFYMPSNGGSSGGGDGGSSGSDGGNGGTGGTGQGGGGDSVGGTTPGGGPIGSESGAGYNSPSIGTDGLGGGWTSSSPADTPAPDTPAPDTPAPDTPAPDKPVDPGWSSVKETQAYNDTVAKNFSDKFGVSESVARTALAADGPMGMVSPTGMSYSAAKSLSDQGYGSLTGVNENNPLGQTVDQALASKNVNDNVMPGVVGAIKAAVPGAGLLTSLASQAGLVASNQKSFGDAVKDSAIGFAAGWTAGKINSAVGSELGGMIGQNNLAGLQAASSISGVFGGPTAPNIGMGIVNGALSEAGISNLGGIASPGTVSGDNGFVKSGTTYGGDQGNGFTPNASTTTPATTTPATTTPATTSINDGLNFNMFDPAKIAAAKQQYFSK